MRINLTSIKENQKIEDISKIINESLINKGYNAKIILCNYEQNREKHKQYYKNYYEKNKEKNKEKVKAYHKMYNKRLREKLLEAEKVTNETEPTTKDVIVSEKVDVKPITKTEDNSKSKKSK